MLIHRLALCAMAAALLPLACAPSMRVEDYPEGAMTEASPERVAAAERGTRKVVNAAWWGFDEKDATAALQAALDSRAPTVIVPDMGKPWIVAKTIELRSLQTVLFERGVEVVAMKGKFRGKGEPLFLARGCRHLTLRGYGATLRMRKADYQKPPYAKAEWRHALSLRGCSDVQILGLALRESGGDGIYVGTGEQPYCEDVLIQDVTCDANHRQGVSVITAQGLLIDNCRLLNTRGTAPQAGIDLEPNKPNERLADVVIRNCLVEGNAGPGIYAYLKHLRRDSEPVSVRVEACTVRRGGSFGIGGGAVG
ncbi:MAG: right-handed parallel beta-helix repeat-containing protein, partial [Planctomycetota bacterium]